MKKYEYKIIQDEDYESPDDWRDEEIFLVYDHRDFCVERKGFYPLEINDWLQGDENYDFSEYFLFPVYAYIHSGIILSLNHNGDRWDTSMRGYVLVLKTLRNDLTEEIARTYAEGCLKNWNVYLSGEIYRYKIYELDTCEYCNHSEVIYIDSCGGYYSEKECEEDAKDYIEYLENKENETK